MIDRAELDRREHDLPQRHDVAEHQQHVVAAPHAEAAQPVRHLRRTGPPSPRSSPPRRSRRRRPRAARVRSRVLGGDHVEPVERPVELVQRGPGEGGDGRRRSRSGGSAAGRARRGARRGSSGGVVAHCSITGSSARPANTSLPGEAISERRAHEAQGCHDCDYGAAGTTVDGATARTTGRRGRSRGPSPSASSGRRRLNAPRPTAVRRQRARGGRGGRGAARFDEHRHRRTRAAPPRRAASSRHVGVGHRVVERRLRLELGLRAPAPGTSARAPPSSLELVRARLARRTRRAARATSRRRSTTPSAVNGGGQVYLRRFVTR